jgi:hypothetical protein
MLGGKLQEAMGRLCIRMFVGELLATPDQGEQLLLPDLLVCHNVVISRAVFFDQVQVFLFRSG